MSMIRILIVDDHILFGEGLKAILGAEPDFSIVGLVGSVTNAVEQTLSLRPDLVLMDFSLPDGSGADAARKILAEFPQCKIVFLTISETDSDLFDAVRSGGKGYISKAVATSTLVNSLRAVLRGESALSPALTLRVMEELARTRAARAELDPRLAGLTHRELAVLRGLAAGHSNREISQQLFMAENTVKYHVHSILAKLSLNDRRSAAIMAHEYGILGAGKVDYAGA